MLPRSGTSSRVPPSRCWGPPHGVREARGHRAEEQAPAPPFHPAAPPSKRGKAKRNAVLCWGLTSCQNEPWKPEVGQPNPKPQGRGSPTLPIEFRSAKTTRDEDKGRGHGAATGLEVPRVSQAPRHQTQGAKGFQTPWKAWSLSPGQRGLLLCSSIPCRAQHLPARPPARPDLGARQGAAPRRGLDAATHAPPRH